MSSMSILPNCAYAYTLTIWAPFSRSEGRRNNRPNRHVISIDFLTPRTTFNDIRGSGESKAVPERGLDAVNTVVVYSWCVGGG